MAANDENKFLNLRGLETLKTELDNNFIKIAQPVDKQDLDTIKTEGRYYAGGGNGCDHRPSGVDAFGLTVYRTAWGWYAQYLISSDNLTSITYIRQHNDSGWTEWIRQTDSGNTWKPNELKSEGYVAAGEGHANSVWMTDGSGNPLWGSFDKVAGDYLPLAGGIMEGPIKFNGDPALPKKTLSYITGIDAFADGGEMGWESKSDFLSNCVKLTGNQTISDQKTFTNTIHAYRYNTNNFAPAITFDKRGAGAAGIGGNGDMIIQFGPVSGIYATTWDRDADDLIWKFRGHIVANSDNDFISHSNEFNFIPSGYNSGIHFNYRDVDRKISTVTEYCFRNGGDGYAPLKASGFKINGLTDDEVLLAGGGHKSIGKIVGDFLPLSGSGTASGTTDPASPMTGHIWFKNCDGIKMMSNNKDLNLWEIAGDAGKYDRICGFREFYTGGSSGNDNALKLYAGGYGTSSGKEVLVREIKQDGTTYWNSTLKILGSADSKTFYTRGIQGSDGNGNAGDLFLNYNSGYGVHWGDDEANKSGWLNSDGSISTTGGITAKGTHDFIYNRNEFTFVPEGYKGDIYINYRDKTNSSKGGITAYHFQNGITSGKGANGYSVLEASGFRVHGGTGQNVLLDNGNRRWVGAIGEHHDLGSSGDSHKGQWKKIGTIDCSAGPWTGCMFKMSFMDCEISSLFGILRVYVRTSRTVAEQSVSLKWETLSSPSYAENVGIIKDKDGKFSLYYKAYSDYTSMNVCVIQNYDNNFSYDIGNWTSGLNMDWIAQCDLPGSGNFLPLSGGTMTGKITLASDQYVENGVSGMDCGNSDITNINSLHIGDPGPTEGIFWDGGSGWKIVECPDNLSNTSGNLQIIKNGTRTFTFTTDGVIKSSYITPTSATSRLKNINFSQVSFDGGGRSAVRIDIVDRNITGQPTISGGEGMGYVNTYFWDNGGNYASQFFIPIVAEDRLQIRVQNSSSTWGEWKQLAYLSDIPTTSGYWADQELQADVDATTTPTFGGVIINHIVEDTTNDTALKIKNSVADWSIDITPANYGINISNANCENALNVAGTCNLNNVNTHTVLAKYNDNRYVKMEGDMINAYSASGGSSTLYLNYDSKGGVSVNSGILVNGKWGNSESQIRLESSNHEASIAYCGTGQNWVVGPGVGGNGNKDYFGWWNGSTACIKFDGGGIMHSAGLKTENSTGYSELKPGQLLIRADTTNNIGPSSTNPRISFNEKEGVDNQQVSIVYTDFNDTTDGYYGTAGLKVVGDGGSGSPAWFAVEGNIHCDNLYLASDRRVKKNIESIISPVLKAVNNIKIKTYNYTKDSDKTAKHIGIIAQDIEKFLPEYAKELILIENRSKDGGLSDQRFVAEHKLTFILWKALQEASQEIEQNKKDIQELKELVNKLLEVR